MDLKKLTFGKDYPELEKGIGSSSTINEKPRYHQKFQMLNRLFLIYLMRAEKIVASSLFTFIFRIY